MTPLTYNPNAKAPDRLPEISEMMVGLAATLMDIDKIKADKKETNRILALCEIITGLPPQWFTPFERQIIYAVIDSLYGSPTEFITNVLDGTLSFVKVCEDDCRGKNTNQICSGILTSHMKKFGKI